MRNAVVVEALPAEFGDSLLVTCATPKGDWRLLVDTGPPECWASLKARLALVPADRAGHRHLDLVVITHIDDDHIGAAAALFGDRTLGLTFGDVWFNAPVLPVTRGVAQGQLLAELLGAPKTALPWNKAWGGRHVVTTADALFVELAHDSVKPKITLLSPTPASLAAIFKVWDAELKRLKQREMPEPVAPVPRGVGAMDLDALAKKVTPTDHAPANGSAIAFLLEHQGVSVLLGADAHPTVLAPALQALAAHRGASMPLQLDLLKLSHHGSKANNTIALLHAVQAKHYVVSTNGAIFNHPDDEAMARVIVEGGAHRTIWFNYQTDRTAKWGAQNLQAQRGYKVKFPAGKGAGVTVELSGHKS